jgi:EAL domain-containing protein (putative c-di-GMP-specific phosphodiesterase class I)/CheY-like chemotaxis protein
LPPPDPRPPSAPPGPAVEDADGCRVLVVDDEPLLTRSVQRLLHDEGYLVDCATSGRDAETHLARRDYDVVLSDIGMPDMGGIELLRRVRERWPDVPVVLVTGAPEISSAVQAFEHGAFHYLVKPVERNTLTRVVRKAAHARRFALVGREAATLLGREIIPLEVQRLEASFQRALDRLWIAYQPIVTAPEGRLFGYEALLRCDEPSLSTPLALIEAAERLGRLSAVGRRVRERAIAPLERADDALVLFVNLHPEDLSDPVLVDPNTNLARFARRIVLEVTERASVDRVRNIRRTTSLLRELGYRIAIDDLGSGFSGLNNFALLEPDIVKIDMALIRDVELSSTKQKLVRSIVGLAHDMGILVVAEGVETAAERNALADLGCDLLQGFLFARPGPPFPAVSG